MKYFNKLHNYLIIKKNNVKIGKNFNVNGRLYIMGNNISIGENVKINSGYWRSRKNDDNYKR